MFDVFGFVHIVILYRLSSPPPTSAVRQRFSRLRVVTVRSLYARAMDLLLLDATASFGFCGDRNTYFVPTDRAFEKLGPAQLRRTFGSASCLRDVLDGHRADRIVPSALIRERWQYEIRTKNDAIVRVANSGGDKLTVHTFDVLGGFEGTRAVIGWRTCAFIVVGIGTSLVNSLPARHRRSLRNQLNKFKSQKNG